MSYSKMPWKRALTPGLILDSGGDNVAVLYKEFKSRDEFTANGRIIICAPEMFEVLEDLDQILGTALHNGHHDLIERVKTVLKKARGVQ